MCRKAADRTRRIRMGERSEALAACLTARGAVSAECPAYETRLVSAHSRILERNDTKDSRHLLQQGSNLCHAVGVIETRPPFLSSLPSSSPLSSLCLR